MQNSKADNNQVKSYTWKSIYSLHWILNPGLAVNELLLGQRAPAITLVEKGTGKSRFESTYVPCPHCKTQHDSRTWSTQNGTAFRNWYGLYCPECGGIIPCLRNATSALILLLTYVIRLPFIHRFKSNWLKAQPARFKNIQIETIRNPYADWGWIKVGLGFGLFMLVFMESIAYFQAELSSIYVLALKSLIWIVAGLGYGYTMKRSFEANL